jgi:eukaryotic-like serine/threonine-protein kinase
MPLQLGARLGPYEILALIGAGGMGSVYKARETRIERIVAVKVSKAEFGQRFEREARAVGSLNHTNICHLYDVGPNYLVMEYVDGTPFAPTADIHALLDQAMRMAGRRARAGDHPSSHRRHTPTVRS